MVLTALMGFTFGIAIPSTSWALNGEDNKTPGKNAQVVGGKENTARGTDATIVGGSMNNTGTYGTLVAGGNSNVAASLVGDGNYRHDGDDSYYDECSTVVGGFQNTALGADSTLVGGSNGVVQGIQSTGIAGGSTGNLAFYALAMGNGSVVTNEGVKRTVKISPNGSKRPEYTNVSTALGYQATANQPGTISFGHDAGDVSGYTVKWVQDTPDALGVYHHSNADGTHNMYDVPPVITENHYDSSYYNRLVKIADGINGRDAVTMRQMAVANGDKADTTADNIGANYKVVKTDESGNTVYDATTGLPSLTDATADQKKANESAWGQALGTGEIVNANDQLVTGGTVYNAMLNKANVAMDNITNDGKTVIRNLAKEAVKVVDGAHTYVTSKVDGNATAYAVNIKTGQVASGDGDLVTGGTVYDAIQNAKLSGGGGQTVDISGKADVSAGNVGQNFTKYSDAAKTDDEKKAERIANENDWGQALGTGKIANSDATVADADTNGSKQLVTGNTVYKEVRPASDGTYIKTANTTAQNLTELDKQVGRGVQYDTVNDTVDKTKITLAGGTDGTTITNVKAGTNNMDAVNVKQLNDKISDVTYTAGDGIDLTNKKISAKAGTGIKVDTNGINVKLGNHLAATGSDGAIDVKADGSVVEHNSGLVTGGTVYSAIQQQANKLKVNAGWGLEKEGNTISLERNLGKNYGVTKDSNSKGKVEFEATGNNSLILGGSAINDIWYAYENDKNKYLDHAYGTFQDDSVLVGGENNATGTKDEKNSSREKGSVVVGGRYNTASGYYTLINGGSHNITNGDYSAILGGYKNEVQKSDWAGYSTIVGGAYNIASGTGATAVGGGDDVNSEFPIKNKASGSYSTTVGGKGNEASGKLSVTVGGEQNKADGWETVVIGGFNNEALSDYGDQSRGKQPFTEGAIVVGGQNNKNSGGSSSIFGGISNLISIGASTASIVGGAKNFASGSYTTVGGGQGNVVLGYNSTAFGGFQSIVNGSNSTGIAGGSTENNADLSLAAGYQSTVTSNAIGWEYLSVTEEEYKKLMTEMQSGKMSGYYQYAGQSDGKYTVLHYKDISTALGYQATADESGTIALGHDKGDTFLTYKWQQKAWKDGNSYYTRNIHTGVFKEISEEEYQKLQNSDGTWNDYTISPNVERGTYDTAYYNRLVKADDGRDAHDVVVMEQLTPYTKSDASNIGANLKTYTVGDNGETITEAEASADAKTTNENKWGAALGTGKVADPNATGESGAEKNGSQQLVTGGKVFKETRISAKDDQGKDKNYNYLDANASAGKNLEKLDSALKTVSTTAGAHTALTVEGGTPAGTKDEKTKQDVYAGKNILLHESTDATTGKVTYDLKLAKDITIGKPGKDGEDGKIGIDGKDGHIGLNGSDGITVRGLDGKDGAPGKDGVTITGPKGEAGKDGIDGKVGISGKDGKDAVSITGKDGVGHIGLTGPAGTNGMNGADGKPGTSIDITVKNGYDGKTGTDGKDGVKGEKGVDGTSLTRIVYTDKTGEHQVATMEDGLKFKGDDTTVIAKKLNNTLDIIGGADSKNLTEKNIGVNSDKDGRLNVQLAKDLKGITSISNQKTTEVDGKDVTTGAKIDLGEDGSVNVNGGKITNVGSGIEKDKNGKYTVTDQNKYNAANVGDVQNMVNDAKKDLTEGANGLNKKANVDASNIGANLKGADGKAASAEAQKANAEKWGSAIGTGKIEKDNGQLVTGKTVYEYNKPIAEDGKKLNYVSEDKTTGQNLGALDSQVKTNADNIAKNTESIQNITNNMQNLSDNAVQYDKDSNKSKVTLGGKDGTTITNVKDGALNDSSTEAVNGKQLYNEQQAREAADKAITEKVTNNTNEITKIKNGEGFTDAGKTVIKNLSKDAVQVKAGTAITVADNVDDKGNKTYTISANNNGTVAKGDGNLISGDTLYKEVHVDKDGSYIKGSNTVGQNLSALDTGLKTTSDLIHTNDKGDTIQIGGNSTATKIDVSGKDANGNTTGRVITGVISDANDPNSAANVGYVNGLTAANTQQIYRDMNNAYSRLDTNINRAAAGSNALAALHPLEFDPADKASFAVGYGHYHNANAAAIGAFYQPNANTMVNMGISLGNGDPGFNAGVSFKLGQGSVYNGVSKAEMAQTIQKQSEQINALEKANQKMEKENEEMKAQIKQILERLNG